MRRLIKFGVALGFICAVLLLGGASYNPEYTGNKTQYQFSWHRGTSAQGNMILDSCPRSDTSTITSMFYNADTAAFRILCSAGDTAGTDDTAYIYVEGLDAFGNVIDTNMLLIDTLSSSTAVDNQFTVYDAGCTFWHYVRIIYTKVNGDTLAGDSTVIFGYRKGDNVP